MANATIPRAPAPIQTPISDFDAKHQFSGYVPLPWADYFTGLDAQLKSSYQGVGHASTPTGGSTAAIGTTPITNQALAAGLYRISFYLVTLVADNVASSATVTIGWTDHGTTRTLSSPALTANSVNAAMTGTLLLRVDNATVITYAVAYSSTGGAPKLQYALDVLMEQMNTLPT